jgi:hypothetical protein
LHYTIDINGLRNSALEQTNHIVKKHTCKLYIIRDSHLSDKEFDRCDANEEYMPRAAHETAAAQQGDEVEGHNEVTMNSIHEMIADGLVSQ